MSSEVQRRTISSEDWKRLLSNVRIPKRQLNQLVMNYLTNEGYREAAEMFSQESGTDPDIDFQSIEERRKIRDAIMIGDIDLAIELINELDPDILDSRPDVNFMLRIQKLVEYIKEGRVSEALAFGQEILAPAAKGSIELLKELERAMSLLAFEDLTSSPVAEYVQPGHKQKVASRVNEAILESQGRAAQSKLQTFMKLLSYSQKKLAEVVSFPAIKDLSYQD